MAEYRRQTIIASAIAIVVALSIGIGVYYMQPQLSGTVATGTSSLHGNTTTSITESGVYPASSQIANSTDGLKLELSINSTTLNPGQVLSINVTEYNTFDKLNNVSAAKDWGNLSFTLSPCGTVNSPVGASVLQGYYTPSNVSSASPLSLFAYSQIESCPAFLYVRYFLFQPMSDYGCMYVLSGNETSCFYEQSPGQLSPISGSLSVASYWDQTNTEHNLSSGVYTVVGGDEWGQMVILHFAVSSNTSVTGLSTTTATYSTTSTSTTTVSSLFTTTVTLSTQANNATPSLSYILAHGCTVSYPSGLPLNSEIRLGTDNSLYLCVTYYYYNSTSTIDLNLTDGQQLYFYAMMDGHSVSVASNFTVQADPNTLVLGGPNNENEGATVVYDITVNGISNGSYIMNIGWLANTFESCASEYKLVVGSGTPNYYVGGSCTAPLSTQYPTNSEGFVNGFIFAEISGTA